MAALPTALAQGLVFTDPGGLNNAATGQPAPTGIRRALHKVVFERSSKSLATSFQTNTGLVTTNWTAALPRPVVAGCDHFDYWSIPDPQSRRPNTRKI